MGLIRDFSEESYQTLLDLVKEVDDEEWCGLTDWIGDRASDIGAWFGNLDVQDYTSDMDDYHKKVIDKENVTAGDIKGIFDKVYDYNTTYTGKLSAIAVRINNFKTMVDTISNCINNGNIDIDTSKVSALITEIKDKNKIFEEISNGELTQDDVQNADSTLMQDVQAELIKELLDNTKITSEDQNVEVPIGPNVTIYYSTKTELSSDNEGGQPIEVSNIIEAEKGELIKMSNSATCNFGNFSVNYTSDATTISDLLKQGELGASYAWEDDTYSYSVGCSASLAKEYKISYSVSSKTNPSVTSETGIKFEENDWTELNPEPVPVTSPYTRQAPDINWEKVGEVAVVTLVVVGAVVLVVATDGAAAPVLLAV